MTENMCIGPIGVISYLLQLPPSLNDCAALFNSPIFLDLQWTHIYLKYFIATFLLELPIYFFLLKNLNWRQRILITFVVNLATHPFIFFGLTYLMESLRQNYLHYLIVAETFAPTVEGLVIAYYWKQSYRYSLFVGWFANLISWGIGVYIL